MSDKTRVILLLEEFGNWWKSQDNPSVPDFVQYKVDNEELDDVTKSTINLIKLSEILGYKVNGKS